MTKPSKNFDSVETGSVNNTEQATDTDITTSEIQSKLDGYPYPGGPVEFGAGEFADLGQISLETRRKLLGSGMGASRLKAKSGLDDNLIEYTNDTSSAWYFPEIRDIHVDQNRDNNTGGHAIYTNDPGTGAPNDLLIEGIFATADGDGMRADFSWGYRVRNSLFEFCNGIGLNFQSGTQNYFTDLFLQENGSHGGEFRSTQNKFKGIHSNGSGGDGFRISGQRSQMTCSYIGQADQNGLHIRDLGSGDGSIVFSGLVVANCGQDGGVSAANRCGIKVDRPDVQLSNIWVLDSQSTPTQDRGVDILQPNVQVTNLHAVGSDTYGVKTKADNILLSGVTATDNQRGANIEGTNVTLRDANLTGNSGTDLVVAGTDVELWNVTADSITDDGTRTRWNGVIGGGPLGGVDISTVTGAEAGDRALTTGASGAPANVVATFDGSDWIYPSSTGSVTPA